MVEPALAELESFFSKFQTLFYKKGEVLIRPEDEPQGMYLLKEGYIRQYSISEEGVQVTLRIFPPQTIFPLIWLITGLPNYYYYETLTNVKILRVPKVKASRFMKDKSEVLYYLLRTQTGALTEVYGRIQCLMFGDAHTKVIAALLYLAEHFGKKEGDKVHIQNWFTHQEIAALAGVVRETVSLEIDKLEKNGILSRAGHAITVNDVNILESVL